MSKKNTGGPAFPIPGLHPDSDFNGATMRDYFAGKALAPLVEHQAGGHVEYGNDQEIAKRAYEIADAMLAERAK